ncbi:hypothetical protein ACF08M_24750 [Streptomyces sp. NPDC015032]|uniref:hypothetical protein n=1 Tax=Streptomyces sp. NPDC015032 TaxID=3364937 RepID=UPI0036FD4E37
MTTRHRSLPLRADGCPRTARCAVGNQAAVMAFHAFRALYKESYLAYATARLGSRRLAEEAVEDTLTALAVNWSSVLGCSHPAAVAWQLLCEHVDHAGKDTPLPPPCCCRHRCVADALVLCVQLEMDSAMAAELMGLAHSEFLAALRGANEPGFGRCPCSPPGRREAGQPPYAR